MKAYTQLIENKVMVSTLPKPDTESYSHILLNKEGVPTNILNSKEYQQALKEFNDSIIGEAENACEYDPQLCPGSIVINPDSPDYEVVGSNQPCEVEGLTITKLL